MEIEVDPGNTSKVFYYKRKEEKKNKNKWFRKTRFHKQRCGINTI